MRIKTIAFGSVAHAVAFGLAYAFCVAFLALDIAGGGHGWNSAIISWCGLLLIPLACSTWVIGARPAGRVIMFVVLVLMMLADILLVSLTIYEGLKYAVRAITVAPFLVCSWAILWIGWQIAFAIACLRRQKGSGNIEAVS